MRIMVTGGAGFIGSHVCELARNEGHEVAALDDLSTGKRQNVPREVRLYEVDIRDRQATLQAFRDFRPDAVSHQAAQASVSVSMREPAFDAAVNLVGGLNVADAAIEVGAERLVFASTGGAIYGEIEDGAAGEDTTPNPLSPYAITKHAFERQLDVYRKTERLQSSVLRYANVFGPRQDPHGEAGVVAIFFRRLLNRQPIQINARRQAGDAGCIRDYCFVFDAARANLAALSHQLGSWTTNVATGAGTSTLELARAIAERTGREFAPSFGPPRPGDVERSVLDPQRFIAALGPPVSLETGLDETAKWFQTSGG